MNKKLKKGLGILAAVVLVILIIGLVLPFFLEGYLKEELVKQFSKQTKDEYSLSVSEVDLGLWTGFFSADSIDIKPNKENLRIQRIKAHSISIDGIEWLSLRNKSFPQFDGITIDRPVVEILSDPAPDTTSSSSDSSSSDKPMTLPLLNINILEGSGKFSRSDGAEIFSLGSFNMNAEELNLNTLLKGVNTSFFDDLSFSGKDFTWNIERKLYKFTVGEFEFDKSRQKTDIRNLKFSPVVPKYRFSELRGRQLDRYDLTVPEIRIRGFDIDSLYKKAFDIDSIYIDSTTFNVFHDKHMAERQGITMKPLLNEVAHRIEFSVGLNTAVVSNSTITYEEHRPKSDDPGHISFDNLNATVKNFRTARHPKFYQDTLTMHTETNFMNAGLLTVDVQYPVFDEMDTHYLQANLQGMDPMAAGTMLENVAFIRVDKGYVNDMTFEMTLNSEKATGTMWLDYEDVKISVLSGDDSREKNLRTRLSSFVANTFVIKSSNTGSDMRKGEIDFEREPDKGIFGYWWKSTLSGIKSSIK